MCSTTPSLTSPPGSRPPPSSAPRSPAPCRPAPSIKHQAAAAPSTSAPATSPRPAATWPGGGSRYLHGLAVGVEQRGGDGGVGGLREQRRHIPTHVLPQRESHGQTARHGSVAAASGQISASGTAAVLATRHAPPDLSTSMSLRQEAEGADLPAQHDFRLVALCCR